MKKSLAMGWALFCGSAVWAVAALQGACTGSGRIESCGEIESGGCPTQHGGTCADPECAALYQCVEGAWQLVEHCPGDGGHGAAGSGGGAGGASGGQGGCEGVSIDQSEGTTGCTPELKVPDCHADVADSCHPCLTGCLDFYLCLAVDSTEVAWAAVAFCNEDDQVEFYP